MNIFEKYGSYEAVKQAAVNYKNSGDRVTAAGLELQCLEYRRQHNIFEVGDWVVKTHPKNTILWPVLGVYKNGGVWLDYKGFCWKPPRVRHATDAEIQAGKRL